MTDLRSALAQVWEARKEDSGFMDWYNKFASINGLDPNPDAPEHHYDYRAAYRAGAMPVRDPVDGMLHLPSEFKTKEHPNRFVTIDGVMTDTITGQPARR